MDLKRLEIRKNIRKNEDRNLSFRVYDLNKDSVEDYFQIHKKDYFFIIIVETGAIEIHLEQAMHTLTTGKISTIFPDQIHFLSQCSEDLSGKIILFEEVLFCSDILKYELSAYNVNLSTHLNCIPLSKEEFSREIAIVKNIQQFYDKPSLIKKEQARFYIKIFLLALIESAHGHQPILLQEKDRLVYVRFNKLLNEQYKNERSVQYYASKIDISTKKLNAITKKHCGETAINVIHNRILIEIKRQLLFSELSHKEIAFDLGFSSPSALNKFVKAKLQETPSELQQKLAQIYNV